MRRGLAAILLAAAVVAAGCGTGTSSPPSGSAAPDALRVAATTSVLADLVAQVGGEDVVVTSLVPKGAEVHTFDPTPSDLRDVVDAELIVMNGVGLDEWLRDVVQDSGTSAPIVSLGDDLEGVEYIAGDEHDEEDGRNPHLWLDVEYAMRYVERIVEALVAADPEHAAAHQARGTAYLARLADLDAWATEAIAALPETDRTLVSFHEALPYLAAAYGLTIAGTIVDAPGQDPSAGELAALVEAIRTSGARAVVGEVQFAPELVTTVAAEAGVPVVTDLYTDTLGDPPLDTYEAIIRWDIERLVDALDG